jgi:hypothetical protein
VFVAPPPHTFSSQLDGVPRHSANVPAQLLWLACSDIPVAAAATDSKSSLVDRFAVPKNCWVIEINL